MSLKLSAAGATVAAGLSHHCCPPPVLVPVRPPSRGRSALSEAQAPNADDEDPDGGGGHMALLHHAADGKTPRKPLRAHPGGGGGCVQELEVSTAGVVAWGTVAAVALGSAVFMVVAARSFTMFGAGSGDGAWASAACAVGGVVLCKCAVAFAKTALFVSFHPHVDLSPPPTMAGVVATAAAGNSGGRSVEHGEGASGGRGGPASDSGDVMRWGGFGIQAGGLVGAIVFFLLTVNFRVL